MIALRSAMGSENPAAPLLGIFLATTASTIAAIVAVRWLSGWSCYAKAPARLATDTHEAEKEQDDA
ncbi:MAG: hypothetical protein AAGF31_00245 [Planctomycetota bacterium]